MENNFDMKVVGITTQQYGYIASQKRKFRINEIVVIEDPEQGNIQGEVIETQSFNRFIPLASEKNKMIDSTVLEGLKQVGYSIDNEETNVAKIRTLTELLVPIKTGSNVRLPTFQEIEDLLIKDINGFTLGVLRGTEDIAKSMPEQLQNKGVLFNKNKGLTTFNGVPFIFDYKSMSEYPHIGIVGGSGSGKSYATRVLQEEIMKKRIPAMTFDPHFEMDFRNNSPIIPNQFKEEFKDKHIILTLGKEVGINFTELTSNDLVNILTSSSEGFTDNMDNAVRTLHVKSDTAEEFIKKIDALIYGLDNPNQLNKDFADRDNLSEDLKLLTEFRYRIYERYKDKGLNTAGLKGIQWRFNRLYRFGLFNKDIKPIIESLLQRKLIVIRGSIQQLQIFAGYVIKKTYSLRRDFIDAHNQGLSKEWFPPFITIMDEAHNFAPKAFDTPTKPVLKEIAQEGRKYGGFLVLATQRPALLDDTIMAQLNTKFVFRTVRGQDIKTLADETDMGEEETSRLPYLPSGEAFVSSAIMGRTVAVRIRAAITTSPNTINPFDELEENNSISFNPLVDSILQELPFDDSKLTIILRKIEEKEGIISSINTLKETLNNLSEQGVIKKEKMILGHKYYIN